jgi:hypothetical protein
MFYLKKNYSSGKECILPEKECVLPEKECILPEEGSSFRNAVNFVCA